MPLFSVEILGINALMKPTKFFLSSTILVWTAFWLMHYLATQWQVRRYSCVVVLVYFVLVAAIMIQAALGIPMIAS